MCLYLKLYIFTLHNENSSFYQFSEIGDDAYSINKLLDSELLEVVFNRRCTKQVSLYQFNKMGDASYIASTSFLILGFVTARAHRRSCSTGGHAPTEVMPHWRSCFTGGHADMLEIRECAVSQR